MITKKQALQIRKQNEKNARTEGFKVQDRTDNFREPPKPSIEELMEYKKKPKLPG